MEEDERPNKRSSRRLAAVLAAGVLALGAVGVGVAGASSDDQSDQARSGSSSSFTVQEAERRDSERDGECPERDGGNSQGEQGTNEAPSAEQAPVSLRY